MEKITYEQAENEFRSWFEAKQLPEYLWDKKADDREVVIASMRSGHLVLKDDNSFTQILKFPKAEMTELNFAFRVTEGELSASTRGIKVEDLIGQMPIAYVATLTKKTRNDIRVLDTVDLNVGKAIISFFSI